VRKQEGNVWATEMEGKKRNGKKRGKK